MDFRWVAFITLWTFLVGPIFGASGGPAPARKPPAGHSSASGSSGPRSLSSSRTTVSASAR